MEEIQLVMTRKSRNVLIVKSWINLLENARNPKESREPGAEEAKQLKEGHECGRSFSQSIQKIGKQAQALQQKRFDIQRICQTGDDSKAKDYEVCKITRADGTSSFLGDFQALLGRLDKQDLFQLYSLVQESLKIKAGEESDMASELIKFIKSQIEEQMKVLCSYTREVLVLSTNLEIQTNHYPLDFRNRRGDEARIKNTWYNQGLVNECHRRTLKILLRL
ncbi:hypothetical protein Tco_0707171 [Tanacetum coccineum]|uniref:Uncharacterized protein n=1 Tax=Tanacetum coccineum TaxID=301880 RepID=A0ABQ4YAC0_9ASTR